MSHIRGMSHIRSVHWRVPVRETLVLSNQLCEVGWPVPFLAAFISPVFPPGPHLLLGGHLNLSIAIRKCKE